MKSFFKELFQYSHYSNQRLFDLFNEYQDKTSEKSVSLFNHILNAHRIWNNRIEYKQSTFGTWEVHALHDLKDMTKVTMNSRYRYLTNLTWIRWSITTIRKERLLSTASATFCFTSSIIRLIIGDRLPQTAGNMDWSHWLRITFFTNDRVFYWLRIK